MSDVIVVGSLNWDRRITLEGFASPGETVLALASETGPGGKGGNQAVAARRAGASVRMVGAVGDDDPGRAMLDALAEAGVGREAVDVIDGVETGAAIVMVDRDGENSIVVVPGANRHVRDDTIEAALQGIDRGTPVLLQFEIPEASVRRAAEAARAAGGVVILSAAPVPPSLTDTLPWVDLLLVNEGELRAVARQAALESGGDPAGVAAAVASRFQVMLVCTLGPRGAIAVTGQGALEQAAPKVQVVDTTAAGDTFAGYLAASLADETPMFRALERAVAAASVAVTREGAMRSIPADAEVEAVRRHPQV